MRGLIVPTPLSGYWLDGERLPSVTTILFPYNPGGSDPLIAWAKRLWEEGKDHIAERNKAGQIGTMAHEAIEFWAKGAEYPFLGDPEIVEPARMAFEGFLKWADQSKFKITHTEMRLTSKTHRYGGTLDVAGFTGNGQRALGDWKTSTYLKETMLMQVAAYAHLWNEEFPLDQITGGYNLLRFSKETGSFTHKWYPDLTNEWDSFLHLLKVYQNCKETRRKL